MFDISSQGIIHLTRGDYCEMPLFINEGTPTRPRRFYLNHTQNKNAVIYFSVTQPNQSFDSGVIRKMFSNRNWKFNSNGDLIITITTQDTMYLSLGKYYYEIKVDLFGDGRQINTVVPKQEFWIC